MSHGKQDVSWSLLLGHDEGDGGAVRMQRRGPFPGSAVEHWHCGQRWRNATVSSHVPQLVGVPVDGVVVVQLNSDEHTQYVVFLYSLFVNSYSFLYHVSSQIHN